MWINQENTIGKLFAAICLGILILPSIAAGQAWYNASWAYRTKLTIDRAKVPNTNQPDFPVLINRTDANWKDTANAGNVGKANGGDLLFTSTDGVTKLDHEIEKYTAATGELIAWVEVPTVNGSAAASNTEIYLYYGNAAAADQWNSTGTWDANFKGVWHLKETGNGTVGEYKDSTSNAHNGQGGAGTAAAVPTLTSSGSIDGAQSFDGADYISVPRTAILEPANITVSCWVKFNSFSANHQLCVSKQVTAAGANSYTIGILGTTNKPVFVVATSAGTESNVQGAALSTGTWYLMTGTYDGTNMKLYVNDVAPVSSAPAIVVGYSATFNLAIGAEAQASAWWVNGIVDEARVSASARSADWIAAEYNNQNAPSTFYTASAQESYAPPRIIRLHGVRLQGVRLR